MRPRFRLQSERCIARSDSRTSLRAHTEQSELHLSRVFRSFVKATIAAEIPETTGNTHPMVIVSFETNRPAESGNDAARGRRVARVARGTAQP